MKRFRQHTPILALLAAIVVVGGLAQLGGFTGPLGATDDAKTTATCANRVQAGASEPIYQDPHLVTEKWQQPGDATADDLADATIAVEAEVLSVEYVGGTPPVTNVRLLVCEALVGDSASEIEVVTLGDGERHQVGDPFYGVGERYVLYLKPAPRHRYAYEVVSPAGRHFIRPDGGTEQASG